MVFEILKFLNCESEFKNLHRIGKIIPGRTRSICIEMTDHLMFRKILSLAKQLKNFKVKGIFVNQFLTGDEAKMERAILKERWNLINNKKIERKNIAIRHGQIFINKVLHIFETEVKSAIHSNSRGSCSKPCNIYSTTRGLDNSLQGATITNKESQQGQASSS